MMMNNFNKLLRFIGLVGAAGSLIAESSGSAKGGTVFAATLAFPARPECSASTAEQVALAFLVRLN